MKKFIVCFVALIFMAGIVSVAFGRTMEEEKQAVRNYLDVLDAKLAKAKRIKNSAKVNMLHVEKDATLARWDKLKKSLEGPTVTVPQTIVVQPTPVVVLPAPVAKVPGSPKGLLGMYLNTCLSGQYIYTGAGSIKGTGGIKADIIFDDLVPLGSMLGMPKGTIQYKLGAGFYYGGGDNLKAIPVYLGGIINLGQAWTGGSEVYLTGGLNYVVYGNGETSGKLGGDAFVGIQIDFGLGLGKTGLELGYSVVRSNTATSKGVTFSVSQPIVL